jgi:hypothetical protein
MSAHIYLIVAVLGCVFGIYDRLRRAAEVPAMPAEASVEVLTRGTVPTGIGRDIAFQKSIHELPMRVVFPNRTISEVSSFSEIINDTAAESADNLPRFQYKGS